jgi:di/tricarboxylate transporter
MSPSGWFSLFLAVAALLTLVFTRVRPHMVMMAVLVTLSATEVISTRDALAGFANSGLITVAAMFVVAAGLEHSGGVDALVNRVLGQPTTLRGALSRLIYPVIGLSASLNNTPVVATMIPAIHVWSRKIGVAASKLMIPLSYASILGGTLTLLGTSTNLVVDGLYQDLTGRPGFSLFSITFVGLPVALVGSLFMWLVFPRLLPDRDEKVAFGDLREFTLEVTVDPNGPLIGKTISQAGLRNLQRIYLAEIVRGETVLTAVASEEVLRGGDRLIFAGDTQAISDLLRIKGIMPSTDKADEPLLSDRISRRLVEVVVSPHCAAVGRPIRVARFRDRYGAVVLAVARNGERVAGNLGTIKLRAGDALLLEARPAFVTRQRFNKDFLLINDTEQQSRPNHERAPLAWLILIALVGAAAMEWMSMLNAALLGAALMVATGCCSVAQAERSLDLSVILTIAASFALGTALEKTGAALYLAEFTLSMSGGSILAALALVYATVSILTEVITNNAAAVLVLPIVLAVTSKLGIEAEPFVFAVMMAASASFATPLGYQTNLMVYGPGGYRARDFLRAGLPMNVLVGLVTVAVLAFTYDLI